MGILSDMNEFEKVNFGDIWNKLKQDPERAFIGAIDPFSSWMWGGITGKDYEPLINQLGGPYGGGALGTDNYGGVYEKAEAKGVNTGPSAMSHDVAELISMFYGGQGAASGLGSAFGSGGSTAGAASAAGAGAEGAGLLSGGDMAALQAADASAASAGTAGVNASSGMGMTAPASGFDWSSAQSGLGLLGQARGGQQQQPVAMSSPQDRSVTQESTKRRMQVAARLQQLRAKPNKTAAERAEMKELAKNPMGLL